MRKVEYIAIIIGIIFLIVGVIIYFRKENNIEEGVTEQETEPYIVEIELPQPYDLQITDSKKIAEIVSIFEEHIQYVEREPLEELPYGGLYMIFRYNNGHEESINIIQDILLWDKVYIVGDELGAKLKEYILDGDDMEE